MKLPADLEARLLAMPGVTVTMGAGVPQAVAIKREKPELVESRFIPPATWVIGAESKSEVNHREFRKRSKRTDGAWRATSKIMGPHLKALAPFAEAYHAGRRLVVTFTRLGGKRLDRSNLPTATKAVEDAVAFMLGADDGDDRLLG